MISNREKPFSPSIATCRLLFAFPFSHLEDHKSASLFAPNSKQQPLSPALFRLLDGLAGAADRFTIDFDNHVARIDVGSLGRGIRLDVPDQRSLNFFGNIKPLTGVVIQIRE